MAMSTGRKEGKKVRTDGEMIDENERQKRERAKDLMLVVEKSVEDYTQIVCFSVKITLRLSCLLSRPALSVLADRNGAIIR